MYIKTIDLFASLPLDADSVLKNAVAESAALHTRAICMFLLTGIRKASKAEKADICLPDLFPDWEGNERYARLKSSIAELSDSYGARQAANEPRWQFDKLLAHTTKHRSSGHEYKAVHDLKPAIVNIVLELERLSGNVLMPQS
jgi:hypothetical protein